MRIELHRGTEGIGLFSEKNLSAKPSPPQIKLARWPKTDKWSGKKYWVNFTLLNGVTSWRCATRLCE